MRVEAVASHPIGPTSLQAICNEHRRIEEACTYVFERDSVYCPVGIAFYFFLKLGFLLS